MLTALTGNRKTQKTSHVFGSDLKKKRKNTVCVCMWICWWVGRQTNNASHSTSIKYTKKKPGSKGNIPLLVILSPYDTVSCSSSSTTRCQWYSHYVGSNQCTSFCNSPLSLQEKPMWLYLTYEFSCVQYHASSSTMIKDHKKTFTYHKCSATHTRTHASTHAYTHTHVHTHREKHSYTYIEKKCTATHMQKHSYTYIHR